MRHLRVISATALLALLVACRTNDTSLTPTRGAATTHATSPSLDPKPVTLGCRDSRSREGRISPRLRDFRIGPLWWEGGAAVANMTPQEYLPPDGPSKNQQGWYFYKMGFVVQPGQQVTISVAPVARSFASLESERGSSPTLAITQCADRGGWFVGGFLLKDRKTGCVPVEARVAGQGTVIRRTISLFAGRCPPGR